MGPEDVEQRDDGWYGIGRVPGRFYISRPFPLTEAFPLSEEEAVSDGDARAARFAWWASDADEDIRGSEREGFEVVLRETPTRQQLKALFIEDTRKLQRLWFQRMSSDGKLIAKESFTLNGQEIDRLILLLQLIADRELELSATDDGFKLSRVAVLRLLRGHGGRDAVLEEYLRSDADAPDVVAVARRIKELKRFGELLEDSAAFQAERERLKREGRPSGPEGVWQAFFEDHKWIFGTGAATQFLHSWNPERLEQTIRAASMQGPGVRPDAVLRSAGAISALALVEIKTHQAPLLAKKEYRSGVWGPSNELTQAVAQCQQAVHEVERTFERKIQRVDPDGFATEEWTAVCRPRSILVVGSLQEFQRTAGTNWDRFEAFERYRRSLSTPEIITFDELYQRAQLSLRDDRSDVSGEDPDSRLPSFTEPENEGGWMDEAPF